MQKFAAFAILAVSTEAARTKAKQATEYIGAIVEHTVDPNAGKFITEEGEDVRPRFLQWASTAAANYKSQDEIDAAEANFAATNEEILRDNKRADESGDPHAARHDHNALSALSAEEKQKRLGVHLTPELETQLIQAKTAALAKAKTTVQSGSWHPQTNDWTYATTPVKDQGGCGSCWAFAANTVLEGTQFAHQDGGEKIDVSKQMIVDCATPGDDWLYGCDGGYVDMAFEFYKNKGLTWEDKYPYKGVQQSCQMGVDDRTHGYVTNHGTVYTEADALKIMEDRPIGAYFAVSNGIFSYSSGLIKNGDGNCYNYPATINHAMAVVGVDLQGEDDPDETTQTVLHARWADSSGCSGDEFVLDDYPDFCVWEVEETVQTVQNDGEKYWKIQNSWGSWWGDGGFAYFAIQPELEDGNCQMYQWGMFYVETQDSPMP